MTSCLVNEFQSLVIEDLNIKGMMSGLTPKAQSDAGMGEIRRQLLYKGRWHHCKVLLADRFYPSTRLPALQRQAPFNRRFIDGQ